MQLKKILILFHFSGVNVKPKWLCMYTHVCVFVINSHFHKPLTGMASLLEVKIAVKYRSGQSRFTVVYVEKFNNE